MQKAPYLLLCFEMDYMCIVWLYGIDLIIIMFVAVVHRAVASTSDCRSRGRMATQLSRRLIMKSFLLSDPGVASSDLSMAT